MNYANIFNLRDRFSFFDASYSTITYNTAAGLEGEVTKSTELLISESEQFGAIADVLLDTLAKLPAGSSAAADINKAATAAAKLSSAISELANVSEGMFFEHVEDIESQFLPENWSELDNETQYKLSHQGIREENYSSTRPLFNADMVYWNDKAAEWKATSALVSQASAAYGEAFVISDTTASVIDVLKAVAGTLFAYANGGGFLKIASPIVGWLTNLPLTALAAGIEVFDEASQSLQSVDQLRYAQISEDTGVRLVKLSGPDFESASGYTVGLVYNTLMATAPVGTSTQFSFIDYQFGGFVDNVVLAGSAMDDTVTISQLPFGEAIVSTAGGADTIKIGLGFSASPSKVIIDSGSEGDTIEVHAGDIEIKSGGGEDKITFGLGGTFKIDAGSENDTIRLGEVNGGTVIGGEGYDTVDYSDEHLSEGDQPKSVGIKFNLAQQGTGLFVEYNSFSHNLISVEKIILTQFQD